MKKFCILTMMLFIQLICFSQNYPLETNIQKGHSNSIRCLSYSPDGKYILSGSRDKTAKLWEISTGREVRTFTGHSGMLYYVGFHKSGNYIITGSSDKSARFWDIFTGKETENFAEHTDLVSTVSISSDDKYVFTGGFDWKAKIWDSKQKKVISEIDVNPDKGGNNGLSSRFSKDGKLIFIGSDNSTLYIHNVADGKPVNKLKGNNTTCGGCFTIFDFSKDEKYVVTANNKGYVKIWDIAQGKEVKTFPAKSEKYLSVNYSFDNKYIIAATEDSIFVWNENTTASVKKIKLPKEIKAAAVSPTNHTLVVAFEDISIKMYDYLSGKILQTFTGFFNETDNTKYNSDNYYDFYTKKYFDIKTEIKISPDGKYFIKGKIDSIARVYDLATGKTIADLVGHKNSVICYDFSKDGKLLATGSLDGSIKIWEFPSCKNIQTLQGFRQMVLSVSFSTDSKHIMASSYSALFKIWETETGKMVKSVDLGSFSHFVNKYAPDGNYFISCGLDKSLHLWENDAVKVAFDLVGHSDIVSNVDFSVDGKYFVSGSFDGNVKLWNYETLRIIKKFSGHKGEIFAVAIDKSCKTIASAGSDCSIKLWDIETGTLIKSLSGYNTAVTSLAFTPDGQTLISCNIESIIKIWDVPTGKEINTFIPINRKDWMIGTPGGFFDATEGAKKSIFFVKGIKTYALDQFFEDFYRPGLWKKTITNRGFLNQGFDLNEKLLKSPPPSIEISSTDNETVTSKNYTLKIRLTDNGGGLNELKVLQNGKRLALDFKSKELKKDESLTVSFPVTLVAGENIFTISAFSKGRIESQSVTKNIKFDSNEAYPTCYLFVIGINKYENSKISLNYARDDADAFLKAMTTNSQKLFKKVEVITLFDDEAKRSNILNKLDEFAAKSSPEDVFIFYYAGHGVMVDDQFYFIPYDCVRFYEPELLEKEGIFAGIIQEKFKKIKALKQLVILDACQSGGSTELLGMRGAAEEKAIAQLSRSAGVHILASAGSEQYAAEFKILKHGLFTFVLLEALNGKADGSPKDGKITIYELKSYIDDQVPDISKKYKGDAQYPYTFSKGNDFPILMNK